MNTPLDPKIDSLVGKLHDHFKGITSFKDERTADVTRLIMHTSGLHLFFISMEGADQEQFGQIETFVVHDDSYGYVGVFNDVDDDNKLVFVDRDQQVAFPENSRLLDQLMSHFDLLDDLKTVLDARAHISEYVRWVQSVVHNND